MTTWRSGTPRQGHGLPADAPVTPRQEVVATATRRSVSAS